MNNEIIISKTANASKSGKIKIKYMYTLKGSNYIFI